MASQSWYLKIWLVAIEGVGQIVKTRLPIDEQLLDYETCVVGAAYSWLGTCLVHRFIVRHNIWHAGSHVTSMATTFSRFMLWILFSLATSSWFCLQIHTILIQRCKTKVFNRSFHFNKLSYQYWTLTTNMSLFPTSFLLFIASNFFHTYAGMESDMEFL